MSPALAPTGLTSFPSEGPPLTPFPEPDPTFNFDPDLGLFTSFDNSFPTNHVEQASPVEVVDPALVLRAEDGHKLGVVLASLTTDPSLLNIAPLGHQSIATQLSSQTARLDHLQAAITALDLAPAQHTWRQIALALIAELEARYRSQTGVKRPAGNGSVSEPPKKKYMLQRGVDKINLYTSAVALTDPELAQLHSVTDTKAIAVQAEMKSGKTAKPIPTLAQVLPAPPTKPRRPPPVPPKQAQVELLYYDPFASFAPTHDSTGATLTYSQTVAARLSRARLRQWEAEVTAPSEPAALLPAFPSPETQALEAGMADGTDAGAEGEPQARGAERGAEEGELWRQLGQNSVLIGQLVREQWARLRGGPEAEGEVVKVGQGTGAGVKVAKVGEREQTTASTLLRSLAALVASRAVDAPPPGAPKTLSLLPPTELIRASAPTLVAALRPAPPTVAGTLDAQNPRAIKEGAFRRKGFEQGAAANGHGNGYGMEVDGAGQAGLGLVVPKREE